MKTATLIVAAGTGSRLGGPVPKQYLPLAGKPLLRHSVETFLDHPDVDRVQVVIQPAHRAWYDQAVAGLALPEPVAGGATRQASVLAGLEALSGNAPEIVLVHDAARPFASAALISRVIAAAKTHGAAIPALAVTDTIKTAENGRVTGTPDRRSLHAVQTPQGFAFEALLEAHRRGTGKEMTDDAAVMEAAGVPVHLVEGERGNIKITTKEDFKLSFAGLTGESRASRLILRLLCRLAGRDERFNGGPWIRRSSRRMTINGYETRTGFGYDVHAFDEQPANDIILGGVSIPHDRRLKGHSDADVLLHALTDAILGTIGEGDIGVHFPPSDPKWKGASSDRFVRHALELLHQRGGRLIHCDLTLVGERPKLSPHREAVRASIARITGLDVSRVSLKATTTERLGFTGREEGLAAQAVATACVRAA